MYAKQNMCLELFNVQLPLDNYALGNVRTILVTVDTVKYLWKYVLYVLNVLLLNCAVQRKPRATRVTKGHRMLRRCGLV